MARSDWFRRVWTLQEAVLAKDLIVWCGPWSTTWTRLDKFLEPVSEEIKVLASLRRPRIPAIPYRLFELLQTTANRQCFDPRDKYFALLGLWSPSVIPHQSVETFDEPSYKDSISHVFAIAALELAREERTLWFLSLLPLYIVRKLLRGFERIKLVRVPTVIAVSWVPELDQLSRESFDRLQELTEGTDFQSMHRGLSMRVRLSGTSLIARGAVLGQVGEAKAIHSPLEIHADAAEFRPLPECISAFYTSPESSEDDLLQWTQRHEKDAHWTPHTCSELYEAFSNHSHSTCRCQWRFSHVDKRSYSIGKLDPGPWSWLCVLFGVPLVFTMRPGYDKTTGEVKMALCGKLTSYAAAEFLRPFYRLQTETSEGSRLYWSLADFNITSDLSQWSYDPPVSHS